HPSERSESRRHPERTQRVPLSSRASAARRGICTLVFLTESADTTENGLGLSLAQRVFTRRARSHAPGRPRPPRPAEDAEPGAAVSAPRQQNHLGLWMETNRARGRASRRGKQFSALSALSV